MGRAKLLPDEARWRRLESPDEADRRKRYSEALRKRWLEKRMEKRFGPKRREDPRQSMSMKTRYNENVMPRNIRKRPTVHHRLINDVVLITSLLLPMYYEDVPFHPHPLWDKAKKIVSSKPFLTVHCIDVYVVNENSDDH
ncbi:hypothetical protein CEXT_617111 [Caerostris extrusa]|uniref:Uncharacterized protein n=1 Tax=Caerostris extrusa TaxID=172846 RepID=A0AAV4XRK5_CAEEX|nr:hypothetical protein CEXT_617111 [Caerostris extrusa]